MKRVFGLLVVAAVSAIAGVAAASWLNTTVPVTVLGVGVQAEPAPFGTVYHLILPVRLPDGSTMTLSVYANRVE